MTVAPKPRASELIDRINTLVADPRSIDPESNDERAFEWRRIRDMLEPLFKVDAHEAWAIHGALYGAIGDRVELERGFKNSSRLGWEWHIGHNWINNRIRVGMLSAAQELYAKCGSPTAGHFTQMLGFGFQAGCLHQAAEFSRKAIAMHIQTEDRNYFDLLGASDMLRDAGITDADVGRHLDIAGNICLKHGFSSRAQLHITRGGGFFSGVTFALAVPVSAAEAFDMNVELAEAEHVAGIDKHIECDVVFKAVA
jgi:hypothetical protein